MSVGGATDKTYQNLRYLQGIQNANLTVLAPNEEMDGEKGGKGDNNNSNVNGKLGGKTGKR